MASFTLKTMIVSLIVWVLVFDPFVQAQQAPRNLFDQAIASPSPPGKVDCGVACEARCRLSSRPNLCKRACGTCCKRCNCVPPGTSGNYDACPCYASLTTRHNRPKCP